MRTNACVTSEGLTTGHTCPDDAPADPPSAGWPAAPLLLALVLLVAIARLLRHRGRELRFLYALMAPMWGHRVFLTTLLRISRTRDGIAPVVRLACGRSPLARSCSSTTWPPRAA